MATVGETLSGGRYRITGVLGEGTQGVTLEAVDGTDGAVVAIKRFEVRGARSWKDVELAEREARVLAELRHPLLPHYRGMFEDGGALCLVMERIEGPTLAQAMASGERTTEADVIAFLGDASEVLDYLHARRPPIIHRDIKPGNVIRRPDGRHVFVDFGSVRDTLKPEGGSTVVGTFGFMAPEQFQGRALPASDVYAAGATALAMLTRRDPSELPHRGLAIDVEGSLRGIASPGLTRVLATLLAPDPDARAPRIAPVLASLGGSERGEPARASARTGPPALLGLFLGLALIVAQIACFAALRVAIPMVLSVLSLVLGRSAARAAVDVSRAGERANRGIARARRWARGTTPSARPQGSRRPRVRVANDGSLEVEAEGVEVPAEEEPRHRSRSRR